MSGHLHIILALGLTLAVSGCAAYPPVSPSATPRDPGAGFTNSRLRTALYEWPADNLPVMNLCLRNSLAIFSHLQQCGSSTASGEQVGGELVFQDCTLSRDGRRAAFLVRAAEGEPWHVAVGFSEAEQQFSLAATPSQKK